MTVWTQRTGRLRITFLTSSQDHQNWTELRHRPRSKPWGKSDPRMTEQGSESDRCKISFNYKFPWSRWNKSRHYKKEPKEIIEPKIQQKVSNLLGPRVEVSRWNQEIEEQRLYLLWAAELTGESWALWDDEKRSTARCGGPTPVIPVPKRWLQEDQEFKVILLQRASRDDRSDAVHSQLKILFQLG